MIQSIDRAVEILEILSKTNEGEPISAISSETGLAISTTHRILSSLMENKLVSQDSSTKYYKLGIRVLTMSVNFLNNNRIVSVSKYHLEELANKQKILTALFVLEAEEVVCVDCILDTHEYNAQFCVKIGSRMPMQSSAAAKIIWANQTDEELKNILEKKSPFERFTERTKCKPNEIFEDLKMSKLRGYAVCDEELERSVVAIAAPIYNFNSKAIAALSVTTFKGDEKVNEQLINDVILCAKKISYDLGYNSNK